MTEQALIFRPIQQKDHRIITAMIKDLYQALGSPPGYITNAKIEATFQYLESQPNHLQLEVFEINQEVVGYALLYSFWYNEFGGMVLNIDELYVHPDFQKQGIASRYLTELETRKNAYRGLMLEVLPQNKKAFSLYRRLNFKQKESIGMYKMLEL